METNYVRVTVKGKIFQMAFNDEVQIDKSYSKRSQVTGHLLIVMPKLNAFNVGSKTLTPSTEKVTKENLSKNLKGAVNIHFITDESEVPALM